jgi:hypothetical protein
MDSLLWVSVQPMGGSQFESTWLAKDAALARPGLR